jgi:AcrR family transcriptional regulator
MSKTHDQQTLFKLGRFQDRLTGKKGQILMGAFKSIAELGMSSTTVRTIATKAGLNSGIVHYYFDNKTELLSRLLEVLFKNLISNIKAIYVSDLSPEQKIDALLEHGFSLFKDRQDEWVVFTSFWIDSIGKNSKMGHLHRTMWRRFRIAMTKILEETTGGSNARAEDIAFLIIGAMEGMVFQYIVDPGRIDPERSLCLLKELIHGACWAGNGKGLSREDS